ncbi:MAG TPA: flavin reductase family protein [Thermomicrobiales bacterium]|nr:flavin reductase family protein [Thermomicrobiales bacterium]
MDGETAAGVGRVAGVEPRAYRDTIGLFATGVTVVTTRLGDVVHGMTANAVCSVSLDPVLLLVCVDRRARMHDLIQRAGAFAVNILAADQEALSGHFAGRGKDGPLPRGLRFERGEPDAGGVPTIAGCVAALLCTVEQIHESGDHTIIVGRVTELRPGPPDARPLLFFAGRYRRLAPLDLAEPPAPDLWANSSAQIYYPEWEQPPDPEEQLY